MSDRVASVQTIETRMDDVRAVMDAAGSARAAIVGIGRSAPMCLLFAATYPGRTPALVLFGGFARWLWAPDYPWRAGSPASIEADSVSLRETDVRHVLPAVRTRTLLIHGTEDAFGPIGGARYMAGRIPGVRLLELPGERVMPAGASLEQALGEVEHFLKEV
jgi:pimeloyl-ACP methyl ester carboxylesterase